MTDLPAYWLWTLFLCPTNATLEATCGPSTGNMLLWGTEADCHASARAYMATVADVPVLREQRFVCWVPGVGVQR